ncbi:MAG: hypothetical protein AAGH43_09340 [Pseudomonadota bacterium]
MSRFEIDVQTDRPDCSGGGDLFCDNIGMAEAGDGVWMDVDDVFS